MFVLTVLLCSCHDDVTTSSIVTQKDCYLIPPFPTITTKKMEPIRAVLENLPMGFIMLTAS